MRTRPTKAGMAAAVAIAALAVASAACSKTTEINQPSSSQPAGAAKSGAATSTTKPVAHVGATLTLTAEGAKAAVTLKQIIDPATGTLGPPTDDNGNPNGDVYVAALLTIDNAGAAAFSGDANNDATIIGSNGQDYTADFDSVSECTNFDNGTYRLGPGESATGCVVFKLPPGITPAKFQYSPASGFASDFGEWLVP